MITVTRPGLRGIRRRGGDKCFGVERLLVRLELEGGPEVVVGGCCGGAGLGFLVWCCDAVSGPCTPLVG